METIQPIPEPIQNNKKNPYKILFFAALGLFLVTISLLVFVWFKSTPTKSEDIVENKPTKTEIVSGITPTIIEQEVTPTKIINPSGWTTYNSKELGLSFRYPNSWGNPEIETENYRNNASEYLKGEAFCIKFKDTWICGFTDDYKNYMAYDQENLDLTEVFNQEPGNIFFTKKVMIDNQNTPVKTELFYIPEAGGVIVMSSVRFRGKTKYSSLAARASYPNLNKVLEPYYNAVSDNTNLESKAINLMTQLKNNKSIDQNLYQDYHSWLSSIKFN